MDYQDYFKDHLISILSTEDLDAETLADILEHILASEILNVSTEDLEYRLKLFRNNQS